jgi:hypothetical protein
MTSRTRDRGAERPAETAVFGRLFLQRMQYYRVLARDTQVWVALSIYVLEAIVTKQFGLDQSLYQILQILSVTIFEKTPISRAFFNVADETENMNLAKQLNLFEL